MKKSWLKIRLYWTALRKVWTRNKILLLYLLFLLPYVFAFANIGTTFDRAKNVQLKTDGLVKKFNNDKVKSQFKKSAVDMAGSFKHEKSGSAANEPMAENQQMKALSEHFSDPLKLKVLNKYLNKNFPCKNNCSKDPAAPHRYLAWAQKNILSVIKGNMLIYIFIFSFIPIISVWAILAMFLRNVFKFFNKKPKNILMNNHLYNLKSIYWENFILTIIGVFTAMAVVGVLVILYAHIRYVYRCVKGIILYRRGERVHFN